MPGDVPEGWSWHRLGDVVEIVNEGIAANAIAKLAAVAHYSLPAFDDGASPEITAGNNIKSNKSLLPSNCVLFSKLNPRIPRVWRVAERSQLPSVCSTEFWPLVARNDHVDLDFLAAFIGSQEFLGDPQITPSSSTNSHQRVDRRSFENYVAPFPPLDEQRRIAEVLRSVDAVIDRLEKSCGAYDRLRTAEVEGFAQASLKRGSQPLESLIAVMDSGWSPDCDGEPAGDNEWGVLKTTSVIWDGFDERHNKRLPVDLSPRPAMAVSRDDILITRAGPAERTGVVAMVKSTNGKRMLSDKLIRIRAANDVIEPLALNELLRSEVVQDQFRALKSGMAASQTNISQKVLKGVAIPNASREEQRAFVVRMTNLDAALVGERQALSTVRGLQKSIASDLLSGRVRVPA